MIITHSLWIDLDLMVFFVSGIILFLSFLMFIFDDEKMEVETLLVSIMSVLLLIIAFNVTSKEYVVLKTTIANKEKIVFTHRNKEHEIAIPDKYKNKKVNIIYDYSSFFDTGTYNIVEVK